MSDSRFACMLKMGQWKKEEVDGDEIMRLAFIYICGDKT